MSIPVLFRGTDQNFTYVNRFESETLFSAIALLETYIIMHLALRDSCLRI